MLRPTTLLPALVAVAATLAGVSPATAATDPEQTASTESTVHPTQVHTRAVHARRPAAERTPLSVTIDSLNPSYVPRRGPVRVTGSVTNEDDAAWTKVYTFAFLGGTPIRSSAELADAGDVDPTTDVGARITDPGSYDTIARIGPGETMQFSITLPHRLLDVTEPGVYWFGVHALGTGPDGRLDGADGRARTFLPLVPRTKEAVDTALVLPLRRTVSYAPDGSVEDVEGWNAALSPGGRLRSMVDLGAAAGFRPITWLVDPGLPDVVRTLTLGNPPRSLAPDLTEADGGGQTPQTDPSASPSGEGDSGEAAGQTQALADVTESGNAWLDRLHEALDGPEILALPYGDVDVSAAAERGPGLYRRARKRSGNELAPWGLPMTPAVASPGGYLDPSALGPTPGRSTVLVTDKMFGADPPAVAETKGARLVTTSTDAATGGPGPDDPLAPVAMRQRILAEAALRLLSPHPTPLVVVLPSYWNPSSTIGFFEGLDVDWLHLTTVSDVAGGIARQVSQEQLDYPPRLDRSELDSANFSSAEALIRAGATLQNVLTDNDSVASTVADQAMRATSYGHRASPDGARAATDRSRAWIEQEMGSIRIDAPPAVTLSSTSGRFAATISNGLDEPVTVSIQALTDEPQAIRGPETVDIGPGGRTSVLLNASFRRLGVHNVTLVVTDADGVPLGSSDQLPIRSAQVSKVIWLILGTGVALLFGAIAVRLFRRVRVASKS
ncbi:DUF6049 family protein [Nocardioides koreensis]|uniref:DUF6049 family protein n=1 Tax=Nocardioides koreensis TaxID=433651 RepID=A0ABN2ZFT2_9ACTN